MQISIVIVTHGRPGQLTRCLQHLEAAAKDCDIFDYQLVIGINGRDRASSALVHEWRATRFDVSIHERDTGTLPSAARNELVALAKGEWLYFVDDDAYVKPDLFSRFAGDLEKYPQASVFGGPNLTPVASSAFQEASGLALGSKFATLFSSPRYRAAGPRRRSGEESLILCNLFMSRESLGNKPFPPEFLCCEENWVLQNIESQGRLLIYDPALAVWHERRPTPVTLAQQIFRYGFGRGQLIRSRPHTAKVTYFAPAAAILLGLLMLLAAGGTLTLWTFVLYAGLCGLFATRNIASPAANRSAWIISGAIFPIVHVSYGLGLLWGIVRNR